MRDAMTQLARFLGRHRRWAVLAWIAVVVIAMPIASHQTDHLTGGGFDVPGSQSKAVTDSLQRDFGADADGIAVVLRGEDGLTAAQAAAAVDRVQREVGKLQEMTLPPAVARQAEAALARTGTALLPLRSSESSDKLIDSASTLRASLDPGAAQNGVTPYLAGQPTIWAGMQELSKKDLAKAEASGFPIVALILLVVFGSLAAAALPLALGFVSVIVTGALIYFISLQMETSVFVTNMASMIGIGVAIDYSLFILARYREEREAGKSQDDARAEALATSGLAVTFSGLAVIISLAGLWMVDNQALRSMALGAMTVVAVSILTATTLLPALIAMLGDRVMAGGGERGPDLLGTLDGAGDGAALGRRDRSHLGPALPRDPGALADDRDRHARSVPEGQRRQGRQRACLEAARRRHRPGADRRPLRRRSRQGREPRRGCCLPRQG
jgi:RND superfamily putative drug exporter